MKTNLEEIGSIAVEFVHDKMSADSFRQTCAQFLIAAGNSPVPDEKTQQLTTELMKLLVKYSEGPEDDYSLKELKQAVENAIKYQIP